MLLSPNVKLETLITIIYRKNFK